MRSRSVPVFSMFLLLLFETAASGGLRTVTDSNFPGGANNITRDTGVELEWLDWTATVNISYNTILAQLGPGEPFEGWQFATEAQYLDLAGKFGLSTATWPMGQVSGDHPNAATSVFSWLGRTGVDLQTFAIIAPGSQRVGIEQFVSGSSTFLAINDPALSDPQVGHALVRAVPVPEPSTWFLLLMVGVVLLIGRRR